MRNRSRTGTKKQRAALIAPVKRVVTFEVGVGCTDEMKVIMSRAQAAIALRNLVRSIGAKGTDDVESSDLELWVDIMSFDEGDVTLNLTGKVSDNV